MLHFHHNQHQLGNRKLRMIMSLNVFSANVLSSASHHPMTVQPTKKKPVSLEVLTKLYSIRSSTQFFSQALVLSHISILLLPENEPMKFHIHLRTSLPRITHNVPTLSSVWFFFVLLWARPPQDLWDPLPYLLPFLPTSSLFLLGKERIIPVGTSASSFLVFWTPFFVG